MACKTYDLKLCPTYCLVKKDQLVSIPKLLIPKFKLFSNAKYLVGHFDLKVNNETRSSTGFLHSYSSSCQWDIIFFPTYLSLQKRHEREHPRVAFASVHRFAKRQLIRQRMSTIAGRSITVTVDKTDEYTEHSLHYQR